MSRYKWIKLIALITTYCALVACEERRQSPQAFTTLLRLDKRESSICGDFGSQLDRVAAGPGTGTSERGPDPNGRILAGYETTFLPGRPPFACDRLLQATQQGVFRFNVSSLRGSVPEPFRGATLEIVGFTPIRRGIQIVDAEPWGLGVGEGWIGSSAPRNTCRFRVFGASQTWTRGEGGWGDTAISTLNLRTGRTNFIAPISRPISFDVSHEVGQWFRGDTPELGFVIMPDDNSINSKASNSCVGLFSVQLRAFFGEDD